MVLQLQKRIVEKCCDLQVRCQTTNKCFLLHTPARSREYNEKMGCHKGEKSQRLEVPKISLPKGYKQSRRTYLLGALEGASLPDHCHCCRCLDRHSVSPLRCRAHHPPSPTNPPPPCCWGLLFRHTCRFIHIPGLHRVGVRACVVGLVVGLVVGSAVSSGQVRLSSSRWVVVEPMLLLLLQLMLSIKASWV